MTTSTAGFKDFYAPDVQPDERSVRLSIFFVNPPFMHVGRTVLGQAYGLYIKRRIRGGYTMYFVSAEVRENRDYPTSTEPIQIGGPYIREEAEDVARALGARLSTNPLFSLRQQPSQISIPIGRQLVTLYEVPQQVHRLTPDCYLEPGDEVYTECRFGAFTFHHSGIYAGRGLVYHFMSDAETALHSFAPVSGSIVLEPWLDYVHAYNTPLHESWPRVYRVAYKLRVRSGKSIVEWAEIIKNSKAFTHYDIRKRNCQHFTSLCSTGASFSYDMSSAISLGCLLLKPGSALMGAASGSLSPRRSLSEFETNEPQAHLKPVNFRHK